MPDILGQFTGTVDAAGGGMVTIVVDVNQAPRVSEGDRVQVMVIPKPLTTDELVIALEAIDTELLTDPRRARQRLVDLRQRVLDSR
jgi:alanine racemase